MNKNNIKKEELKKQRETELAKIIVDHLNDLGYDVYKEVSKKGGGSDRADIYAIRNNVNDTYNGATVSIETKMSFNITVLKQAYNWRQWANLNYVAVPVPKRIKDRTFIHSLCEGIGVGLIEVDMHSKQCYIIVNPKPNENIKPPTLYEEQKLSIAGNANNQYMTPFKITCARLKEFMKDKEYSVLSTTIKSINHHYKSNISASASLSKYLELGIIEGLTIRKTKSGTYIININNLKNAENNDSEKS